jgi:hypothetical protein
MAGLEVDAGLDGDEVSEVLRVADELVELLALPPRTAAMPGCSASPQQSSEETSMIALSAPPLPPLSIGSGSFS